MKKAFIWLVVLVLCLIVFLKLTNNVVIIEKSAVSPIEPMKLQGLINPLSMLSAGDNCTIFLEIAGADRAELPEGLRKAGCLKLTQTRIDSTLLAAWNFSETGGDMATVGSRLYVLINDELVFKSGIVLTDHVLGLQHKEFGWLEPASKAEFRKSLSSFKPVYFPVIII